MTELMMLGVNIAPAATVALLSFALLLFAGMFVFSLICNLVETIRYSK